MQESSGGLRAVVATLIAWIGIAMILVASFTYTDASPFPGTMALLPVVGTPGHGPPISGRLLKMTAPVACAADAARTFCWKVHVPRWISAILPAGKFT